MGERGGCFELTPATLAELIGAELDQPLVGEWSLFDLARSEHQSMLALELERRGETLTLEVRPRPGASNPLAVSWRRGSTAPEAERSLVCAAVEAKLREALADTSRSFALPEAPSLSELREAATALLPADLREDPDAALLARDLAQYERVFGARPRAVRAPGGVSIFYPPPRTAPLTPGVLRPVGGRLRHRRFRRFLADRGCFIHSDQFIRTVPTPATFARLCPASPAMPRMIAGPQYSIAGRRWVEYVLQSVLPVGVAPRWSVPIFSVGLRLRVLSRVTLDVGLLNHDISMHALAFHAIPREHWRTLVAAGRGRAPEPVATFFEGTLTRSCWEIYDALDEPTGFADAFEPRMSALLAELAALPARR